MNTSTRLRLTLDVSYTPNGVSVTELETMLRAIADHAAGDGLMTGDTPAEVDEWKATVDVLSQQNELEVDPAALHRELLGAYGGNEDRLCMVLDDLVHDAEVGNASEVNNQGARAQVEALLAAGVHASTIRDLIGIGGDARP